MDGRTSKIAEKIRLKYGKPEIGKIYDIDGIKYKLTDGSLDYIFKKIQKIKEQLLRNVL